MPKLFCVVVGGEGSPFPVDVAAEESVGDLKKKIKVEKDYKFPADELDLYLAKSGDAWLNTDGAKGVALDEDGKLPGFEVMDPTFSMKNPKCIGVDFERKDGDIHVLVVVPEGFLEHAGKSHRSLSHVLCLRCVDSVEKQTFALQRHER